MVALPLRRQNLFGQYWVVLSPYLLFHPNPKQLQLDSKSGFTGRFGHATNNCWDETRWCDSVLPAGLQARGLCSEALRRSLDTPRTWINILDYFGDDECYHVIIDSCLMINGSYISVFLTPLFWIKKGGVRDAHFCGLPLTLILLPWQHCRRSLSISVNVCIYIYI